VKQDHAAYLASKYEAQLEEEIKRHRSMGEHGGVQHATVFNRVIALKLGTLLDQLEQLGRCRRRTGSEAVFPLRSHAQSPVTLQAVEASMLEIEGDFRTVGRGSRSVFGLPLNQAYMDYHHIWQVVRDSRILEIGDESCEYAVKVSVYPYACGILSIWVFVAVAISD